MNRFEEASPLVLESYQIIESSLGTDHPLTKSIVTELAVIHETWHEAEPDGGYDAKAAEYRALLEKLKAADD